MHTTTTEQSKAPSLRWAMRILALAALSVSVYLLVTSVAGGTLAGCDGETEDCDQVLSTRWATWLGIPVSAAGVAIYAGIFAALLLVGPRPSKMIRRMAWSAIVVFSVLAAGAALWFIGIQIFLLDRICIYCMTVHTCGLVMFGLVSWTLLSWRAQISRVVPSLRNAAWLSIAGLAGVCVLIAGQLLVQPRSYAVETFEEPNSVTTEQADAETEVRFQTQEQARAYAETMSQIRADAEQKAKSGSKTIAQAEEKLKDVAAAHTRRPIRLAGGQIQIYTDEVPLIGSPDATHVIAIMFDYTCDQCRQLHKYLIKLEQRHHGRLAIAMLPVPLEHKCNHYVRKTLYKHHNACAYAKLALAVWKLKPEAFERFDGFMVKSITLPSVNEAREMAEQNLGVENIEEALVDQSIDKMIQRNIVFFGRLKAGVLPKLVVSNKVFLGLGEPSSESILFALVEEELNLPTNSSQPPKPDSSRRH